MKIQGNTVGTPIKPKKVLVKSENLTEEEKAIARENIGATEQTEYGVKVYSKYHDSGVSIEPVDAVDDTGYTTHINLGFLGATGDEPVRLCGLEHGENDRDAATVGQLKEALLDYDGKLTELLESVPIKYMPVGTYCLSQLTSGLYYFAEYSKYLLHPNDSNPADCSGSFMLIRQINYSTTVIEFNAISLSNPVIHIKDIDLSGDYPNIYSQRIKLKELYELFDRVENTENALGDVEAALDSIIAIQESLIGGAAE